MSEASNKLVDWAREAVNYTTQTGKKVVDTVRDPEVQENVKQNVSKALVATKDAVVSGYTIVSEKIKEQHIPEKVTNFAKNTGEVVSQKFVEINNTETAQNVK